MHYWSVAQVNAYRLYTRNTSISRISIDATGSVVRHINLLTGRRTKAIFFYEIAIHDSQKCQQFPVAHMLSERHNNTAIVFWLLSWLREDIKSPDVCVTDHSRAFMMACVRAFTQYHTLESYRAACSALLKNEREIEIPNCMLRNDFAHTMHSISSWPEIKPAHRRSKNFYLRSIALIIACDSFEEMKKLLKCLFTVLLNEVEGNDENGVPTCCDTAKQYLRTLIASREQSDEQHNRNVAQFVSSNREASDITDDCVPSADEIDDTEPELCGATTIFQEIQAIYDECFEESTNSHSDEECVEEFTNSHGDRDNLQF